MSGYAANRQAGGDPGALVQRPTHHGVDLRAAGQRPKEFYASVAESTRAAFSSKFWNGSQTVCSMWWMSTALAALLHVTTRRSGPTRSSPSVFRTNSSNPQAARQVLAVVERELLTPFGLRTLSPRDPQYRGVYAGDVVARDSAYHQGTVWPWLMGPFIVAHFEAHNRDAAARQRCLHWLSALREYRTSEGMNQLPEVFDGDPPHRPGGCPAQAWSLATIIESFLKVY